MPVTSATRVVILGGGFAGLHTALHLQRAFRDERELQLTLVNRENHFLFTPMLHEVAASDLDVTHIVNPVRKLLRRGIFFTGEVEQIDLDSRQVVVSHADGGHKHALEYDHLVVALGSVTNFFDIPGLRERALTMRTLGDAIALRNRIIGVMEEADFECASGNRHDLLTVLVAGGGFAGVETIAAINDFMHAAMPYYPHLTATDMRVVLVEGGPRILAELSPRLAEYTQRQLAKRGVEVRLNTSVVRASDGTVVLSDGTSLRAQTIVWTAGNTMNPVLANLPCATARGRIAVDAFLKVDGWKGVWALGDCAAIPDRKTNGFYPPTAQHALREAKVAAHNIAAELRGGSLKAFSFKTIGQLAAVGRRAGVANIFGINFSGFVAWWLWRTIYLSKLPRLERKIRVALDWTLDLFLSKDIVQFQNVPGPTVSQAEVAPPAEHSLAS